MASEEAVQLLQGEADEVVALSIPANFAGVGQFYRRFEPVEDSEVLLYLNMAPKFPTS